MGSPDTLLSPKRLDKGQGHRIATSVIRYHSTSSSSGDSNPASPAQLSIGNIPPGYHANSLTLDYQDNDQLATPIGIPFTTLPTPKSPSRHPLTLKVSGARSPFDLGTDPLTFPTGGTTALGRRVPITRVSADIQTVCRH